MPGWAKNLLTLLGALGFLALACEFVLFRLVMPGTDLPANAMIDGLIRWQPDSTGVYRRGNAIAAPFRINRQGWNSRHESYAEARSGKCRALLIGDSYVEAFQVEHRASLAERLEDQHGAEVYRFGISGAPLSQYVLMAERLVPRYAPDRVIVLLVHNDFVESYRRLPGRFTSSFLKLDLNEGRVAGETPPAPYVAPATDWLRRSATMRFFWYRWNVTPETLRRALGGGERFAANVAVDEVAAELPNIRVATEHLFARLARLGRPVLVAMDGVRQAIYDGSDDASGVRALNRLAAEAAARHGLAFLDLHTAFAADWAQHRQRFDFGDVDFHWNQRGHDLAARAIGRPC